MANMVLATIVATLILSLAIGTYMTAPEDSGIAGSGPAIHWSKGY